MKPYYVHKYSAFDLIQIPTLKDNYSYIIKADKVIVIDPGEAQPIINICEELQLQPTHILNTHHHWDHTDGNLLLQQKFRCEILGSALDASRIPGLTKKLDSGPLQIGRVRGEILTSPGHTAGHVLFYVATESILFTGDVLFCGGCGRVFEGSMEEMYFSLQKIKALPPSTQIFCGHEYSLKNLDFADHIGIKTDILRAAWQNMIAQQQPIVPSTLSTEFEVNPFLRAQSPEEFSRLRLLKDKF